MDAIKLECVYGADQVCSGVELGDARALLRALFKSNLPG
jgi:hypothetical protein